MKLRDFPLLTDENIDPDVVVFPRQQGFDVLDVVEQGLQGSVDVDRLRLAMGAGRHVVTHDTDVGTLAVLQHEPLVGVVYLRPAHIDPQFTIGTLQAILNSDPELAAPFILVAKRMGTSVAIRVRQLP